MKKGEETGRKEGEMEGREGEKGREEGAKIGRGLTLRHLGYIYLQVVWCGLIFTSPGD